MLNSCKVTSPQLATNPRLLLEIPGSKTVIFHSQAISDIVDHNQTNHCGSYGDLISL